MKSITQLNSIESPMNMKKLLSFSLLLLLFVNFTLGYFAHTYFSDSMTEITSPGFWMFIFNFIFITWIVIWNKQKLGWSWGDLGLGTPKYWWLPILTAGILYGAVQMFGAYAIPHILELGERPDISHLMALQQNLPKLIFMLTMVWITAAFLEELIFRAYLINTLDILLGKTKWTPWAAMVISSVIFGLLHFYQGITGVVLTGSLGLIFGTAFLLNGRRIWSLILIHGLIDTVSLISIYNM